MSLAYKTSHPQTSNKSKTYLLLVALQDNMRRVLIGELGENGACWAGWRNGAWA
jgi:hypothetical protein